MTTNTTPDQTPWEALAHQARALADHAERMATLNPADLAPGDAGADDLALLAEQARAVTAGAAACRRHTWQQLRAQGMTLEQIGTLWGIGVAAVGNALKRGPATSK